MAFHLAFHQGGIGQQNRLLVLDACLLKLVLSSKLNQPRVQLLRSIMEVIYHEASQQKQQPAALAKVKLDVLANLLPPSLTKLEPVWCATKS
jgi:hypothetical protein